MTELINDVNKEQKTVKKFGCLQVFGIVLLTVLVTAGITLWVAKIYIFPSQFKPVTLSAQEEQQLSVKLDSLGFSQDTGSPKSACSPRYVVPNSPFAISSNTW